MGLFRRPSSMSNSRERPTGPFDNPRNPRPKGSQKGVVKRENRGRGARQGGTRDAKKSW